ncbi:hypothetical protein Dsin_012008 [Dipteronia sinensis]|uniref:MULE transposase domain-containing protein n=1 Tax=Dipteronia sinensis TaxID=43782 RepID=A0AAE0AH72_9ROSI|nr:hypothetical protein Dsin_012008 [Dipteronia sinensis]
MRDMREKHGVELLYTKAWMSTQHIRPTVYGKANESYQFLPSYFHILVESNPGIVTTIETDEQNQFLYAFLSSRQSLQGFQSVIRLVVAINTTNLKSDYGGVMFVAICKMVRTWSTHLLLVSRMARSMKCGIGFYFIYVK